MSELKELLNEIYTATAYEIYIPSLGKHLKFKPFIIEQYQEFIDTVTRNPYFNVGFQKQLTSVIRSNIITDDAYYDINNINELDKAAIALTVRVNDISSTYKTADISSKINEIAQLPTLPANTINHNNIIIRCQIPNLIAEERYNDYVIERLKDNVTEDSVLKDVLNVLFIAEISKYVVSVTVNDNEHLLDKNFEEWTNIVSSLPTNFIKDIVSYIDNVKSVRDNLFKIDDTQSIDYDLNIITSV